MGNRCFCSYCKTSSGYVLNGQMDDRIKKLTQFWTHTETYLMVSLVLEIKMGIDSVFYPSHYDDEPFADYTNLSRVSREYWNIQVKLDATR